MKQVLDFLNKAGVFYLATTESNRPEALPAGWRHPRVHHRRRRKGGCSDAQAIRQHHMHHWCGLEGEQPRVRPIGFVMEHEGKLAFCTANDKDMYRQLVANPKVEVCCYDGEGNTLRICGKAVFATTAETQQKALELMPALKTLYSAGDGVFEVYYLDEAKAVCSNVNGEKQELPL